jgi:gas vesicle protein
MSEYERQEPVERDLGADERSPEAIEREIERTRERMSNHIDALGDKLSPENLKQQAKEAISGKAQDVVANVGDQARQTGSRVLDFITENPLPVAAVTLGAIWLFSMRKGNQSEVSGDRMARFAYTGPERREPDGHPGLGRRVVDRAGAMRDTMADAASHAGERAGELKERMQERAGELGSSAKERARDARGGLERMMGENPLMIAAGAAVIGLALGMLVPESEKERQVLGSTRDQLVDRVQETASRVKEAAVEAGREVQETLREEVNQRGGDVKSTLKEAATTVKEQIKESAGRVAEEAKQELRKTPQGGTG